MTNEPKAILLALTIAVGFPMAALAQGDGNRASFADIDANADGQISQDEMLAHRNSRFTTSDANGDGQLTRDELVAQINAGAEERADRMIERFDANDDGQLSEEEVQPASKRAGRLFDRIDSDDSGSISEAEFDAASDRMGRKGRKNRGG